MNRLKQPKLTNFIQKSTSKLADKENIENEKDLTPEGATSDVALRDKNNNDKLKLIVLDADIDG